MGHVVVHRDAQGTWQVEDVASLDAALERVETLRNVEQRDEVRLFEELALEVRTYYRVALAGDRTSVGGELPSPPTTSAPPPPLAAVEGPADNAGEPDRGDGDAATTDVAPPPGTFPLAAPPVPAAVTAEPDGDRDTSVAGRRGSRFARDR